MVGFVVAGGRSLRMGRDKALLEWRGGTLLDHAIGRLRAVCGEVRVLSGSARRYADRGLPVDMPFVTAALLARIRDDVAGWDAALPQHDGGPEPLCAAYAPACLGPVR